MYYLIEHVAAKNDDFFDVVYCRTLNDLKKEYANGSRFGGWVHAARRIELTDGHKPKRIFWNVDTQYDFMRPDGKLYVEGAAGIELALARLTMYANMTNEQKVNTGDKHKSGSKELSEAPDFMNSFPEHCMEGTKGMEFVEATRPKDAYVLDWTDEAVDYERMKEAKDIVIYKDAFDIFAGNPHADRVVKEIDPSEAIVYGVATNVCVDFAVMGLLKRDVEVYVPTDAIRGLPNLPLEETLTKWVDNGAILTTVDDVISGAYRR